MQQDRAAIAGLHQQWRAEEYLWNPLTFEAIRMDGGVDEDCFMEEAQMEGGPNLHLQGADSLARQGSIQPQPSKNTSGSSSGTPSGAQGALSGGTSGHAPTRRVRAKGPLVCQVRVASEELPAPCGSGISSSTPPYTCRDVLACGPWQF